MKTTKEVRTVRLFTRWGTSRGTDTYGYTTVTLRDWQGTLYASTCGGGYDLYGTVVAKAAVKAFPEIFNGPKVKRLAASFWTRKGQYIHRKMDGYEPPETAASLYGLYWNAQDGTGKMDGGTGIDNVRRVLKRLGITVVEHTDRKGNTVSLELSAKI